MKAASKTFGGLIAVDHITLSVEEGEIFAIVGPNGSGKTTLFNIITGILKPDDGCIMYNEKNITKFSSYRRSLIGIGRTFQITQPFESLTVEENVMVGTIVRHTGLDAMREDAQKYIEMVGLNDKRLTLAKELSTGQRKRLELARAMATQPKLLLLDEVTGGVDHASLPGIIELIEKFRDIGVTIVLIEHNMRVITRLADNLMFLDRGNKIVEGTAKEISEHPAVIKLYLGSKGIKDA